MNAGRNRPHPWPAAPVSAALMRRDGNGGLLRFGPCDGCNLRPSHVGPGLSSLDLVYHPFLQAFILTLGKTVPVLVG